MNYGDILKFISYFIYMILFFYYIRETIFGIWWNYE